MDNFNQNIDLNLYKTFYAVAESKSFSKATEKIYISQPAISHNIKELEKNLKIKLFYRTPKGVSLTPEGETLYHYIKKAYDYIFLGEQRIKDSKEMLRGEIRIGVPTHIGIFYLADKIEDFHNKYPNIKFYIQNRSTSDMVYMLEKHQLDFIIDSYPIDKNTIELTSKKLVSLETAFVGKTEEVNKYSNGVVKKEEIKHIPLILPNANTSTRKILNQAFAKHGIQLKAAMEISTTEMTLNMIKKGMGVAWLVQDTVTQELKDKTMKKLELDLELPKLDIGIAYIDNFITYAPKRFIEEEII